MIEIDFDVQQWRRVAGALKETPRKAATFVRQEMQRGGKRFVRSFIRQRLSGRPGIKAGKILKGSLKLRVSRPGTPLSRLRLRVRGSGKIWEAHEKGALIRPRRGKFLAIPVKARGGGRSRKSGGIRLVKQVVIRPRLQFGRSFEKERPSIIRKMGEGLVRALKLALQGRR